jgi:fused signal recognition particle receptor
VGLISLEMIVFGGSAALSVGVWALYLWRKGRKPTGTPKDDPIPTLLPKQTPSVTAPLAEVPQEQPVASPWQKALAKSREPLLLRLKGALLELGTGRSWDQDHPIWERLEETLLAADVGPKLAEKLLQSLRADFREQPTADLLTLRLKEQMLEVLGQVEPANENAGTIPLVTVLVGVNGAGKTTTAGKLAALAVKKGGIVVLGAADTFRAAAVEQLKIWSERLGAEFVGPAQGANPAAVAFDAVAAGLARSAQEVIIDTAGRLHTKDNLMEELKKVMRVIDKKMPGAPHRTLLVLDATLGQNALAQAREFAAVVKITGVVLSKLDGSSKGGAAFAVAAELGLPIQYVGLGESAEDLRPFVPLDFVNNLLPS